MIGSAKARSSWTTRPIQTNTGVRNSDMPGARMLTIVTARFTAPVVDEMPVMIRPRA